MFVFNHVREAVGIKNGQLDLSFGVRLGVNETQLKLLGATDAAVIQGKRTTWSSQSLQPASF